MLLSVTEHLTEFNQAAEKLMKGRVSQQNFELIKYPSLNYPSAKKLETFARAIDKCERIR